MPEGDSAWWAAEAIHRTLAGQSLVRASLRGAPLDLRDQRVAAARAMGKHVLIGFEGPTRTTVRVHLGLSGAWRITRRPARDRDAPGLLLASALASAVCVQPAEVAVAPLHTLLARPPLSLLGPDVMLAPPPLAALVAVARARWADEPVILALRDQRVASGIGNVCALEALFRASVHPATPLSVLPDPVVAQLFDLAAALLRRDVARGTRGDHAPRRVYAREGRPCVRCRGPIAFTREGPGGRRAFWCPRCQPASDGPGVDVSAPIE